MDKDIINKDTINKSLINKGIIDKDIVVLGDIEMGAGNLTDDFISDKALAGLILSLSKKASAVDLVLNGDTFDFLKCPSQLNPTVYPRHITAEVSLAKLQLIHAAHKPVFSALKTFAAQDDKRVIFILGNHDHDLIYPAVQKEIQRLLGNNLSGNKDNNEGNIIFPGLHHQDAGIYVEHGQQYDFLFTVNFEKLFLNHRGKSILNFPYLTFGLISAYMHLKEQHPFLERIFPRPALLTHHQVIAREFSKHSFRYFLKSLLYYPFRFYSDPTYAFPSGIVRELYKRLRTVHWDVDDITSKFLEKRVVPHDIIVLGHIHEKRIQRSGNKVIIHPGSWRDEYDFQAKTRELIPRSKRYVHITRRKGKLDHTIIDLPLRRNILSFDEVLKDEFKYLQLAVQEEKSFNQQSILVYR
ncbi:MAG: hypothetical protein AABX13_01915 [Nanoarchaeota archaeon]